MYDSFIATNDFEGLTLKCKDQTYIHPVDFPICPYSGGCDILMYDKQVAQFQVNDGVDNSDDENETSNIASFENKERNEAINHDVQVATEGLTMAARMLFYKIEHNLESPENIMYASSYGVLIPVGGTVTIWKFTLNFKDNIFQRTPKLYLSCDANNLAIVFEQIIRKIKQ